MKKTKELAFLNFLKHTTPTIIDFQNDHVTFSINDLENKMELDKKEISNFLAELKNHNFLDITELSKDTFNIHFHVTYNTLMDFINPHDIDEILEDIYYFISKYSFELNFDFVSKSIFDATKEIYPLIKNDPNCDISPIIRKSIIALSKKAHIELYFAKLLFSLSDKIEDVDQKIYENIFYYFLTLPYEDNPFITTLLLSKVFIQIEAINNGVTWDKVLDFNSDTTVAELEKIFN